MRTRSLVLLSTLALAPVAAAIAPVLFNCPLTLTESPDPEFVPQAPFGTAYSASGLAAPEPVPLGVDMFDEDTLAIDCAGNCVPQNLPGVWTARWSCTTAGGLNPGAFLAPTNAQIAVVPDASYVLYLPPSDLAILETRTISVVATLLDPCATFTDAGGAATFTVTVFRTPTGRYNVSVTSYAVSITPETPPPCYAQDVPCELLVGGSTYLPPTVTITGVPITMRRGMTRMLTSVGEDLDQFGGECGTPPGVEPVRSTFAVTEYCDRLTYDWAVIAGPGNGVFVAEGRSALFLATVKGSVTIQLTVTGTDGEFATDQKTFTIL